MAKTECPQCHNALQLPDDFVGKLVKCPLCHNTFTPATTAMATTPLPPAPPPVPKDIAEGQDDWDDNEAPRRPARDRRRRFEDDDEDDYDIRRNRRLEPHRGAAILTFGILGLVCCGPIFGPIAWIMGTNDLKSMADGRMDNSGEGITRAGQIVGIVSTILSVIGIALYVLAGMAAVLHNGG
jgi:hypothetical protein